jgi:hypothetical protein
VTITSHIDPPLDDGDGAAFIDPQWNQQASKNTQIILVSGTLAALATTFILKACSSIGSTKRPAPALVE